MGSFREDGNGFGGNWLAAAYAICADPLPGLQRVAATSASTSAAKSVTATCPTGKRLVGLGGDRVGGAGQVVITTMRPEPGLTKATVLAREAQGGYEANWTVSAYAICATAPQGLQRVTAAARHQRFAGRGGAVPGGEGAVGCGWGGKRPVGPGRARDLLPSPQRRAERGGGARIRRRGRLCARLDHHRLRHLRQHRRPGRHRWRPRIDHGGFAATVLPASRRRGSGGTSPAALGRST